MVFWTVQHSHLTRSYRARRPSGVFLALRRPRSSIHWRFPRRCPHWHGRSRPGWVPDQQRPLHRFVVRIPFTGIIVLNKIGTASLSGLASQATARQGNALGILGVGSGILASLAAVGFPLEVLAQFAGVAAIGGTAGAIIGRRITATELPQMVAALHSVVGLAAVLTSIGSVIGTAADHLSVLHLVTAYLGVLIGTLFSFLACAASGDVC